MADGKKIGVGGIVLAVLLGIVVFWIVGKIIGFVLSLGFWLLVGAIVGGVAYLGYRKFQNMLSSGKRLT